MVTRGWKLGEGDPSNLSYSRSRGEYVDRQWKMQRTWCVTGRVILKEKGTGRKTEGCERIWNEVEKDEKVE